MKKILFLSAFFAAFIFIGSANETNAQSVVWRGRVDDTVELRIRRQNVQTVTTSGQDYGDGRFDFDGGGMNRDSEDVQVSKESGRGRVYIVQRPNRRNRWTTIVRIEDRKGGADRYRVRVTWN